VLALTEPAVTADAPRKRAPTGARVSRAGPRGVALWVLNEVLQRGRSLSDALVDASSETQDARDHALVRELCFGTLRWYHQLAALAEELLSRPLKRKDQDVRLAILLGMYQLMHTRMADHAAVGEAVELVRAMGKPWAAGLVNGVLRGFQRRRQSLISGLGDDASRFSFPDWLLAQVRDAWPTYWQQIVAACNARPPLSLRVNARRISRPACLAELTAAGLLADPIPHTEHGLVLRRPGAVAGIPGFSDGRVSVQDGGAQLAAPLLDLRPGQQVLDACAAPGGKTCQILEAAPGLAGVTAIDIDGVRLQRVQENLSRLGLRAELQLGDASRPSGDWSQRQYDRVLLDVPCSATGVVRRHPDIKVLRQAADIPRLVSAQGRMLEETWGLLRTGGILLYATCSLLPQENEVQVSDFLARRSDARERRVNAGWGHERVVGRQILPGEWTMDGFYYACLEKV